MNDLAGTCPACLLPFSRPEVVLDLRGRPIACDVYKNPTEAFRLWSLRQPKTAVCSHPCPIVCAREHCGADVGSLEREP